MKQNIIIALIIAVALSSFSFAWAQGTGYKGTPPPMTPDVSGLDEYSKMLVFADTNLQAGDYDAALDALKTAEKIKKTDPFLYEMFGIVYMANREPDKAFQAFKKAAYMYIDKNNPSKASEMLQWMKTLKPDSELTTRLEKNLSH